jgi:aldehyde dehydrogenase (NAD(P)+)
VRDAVERALADLRYGTVAINQWPALAYLFSTMPWGGHPSSTLANIQSGLGWVHNTFMLDGIEKGVLRAPLAMKPKPMWDPSHRTAHRIAQKLVEMETAPSWGKVPALLFDALRG